jgi:hypothetical protein
MTDDDPGGEYTRGPRPYEPSPQEIADACEEIQLGWSKDTKARRHWHRKVPWQVPEVLTGGGE